MITPRDSRLRRLYNITEADYDLMAEYQDGVCWLCQRPPAKVRLSVDHDHKSGFTRGLLCVSCNRALRESMTVEWLEAAAEYLLNPPAQWALGRQPVGRVGRITNKRKKRSRRLTTRQQ